MAHRRKTDIPPDRSELPDLEVAPRLEPLLTDPPTAPSRRVLLGALADAIATFRRCAAAATPDEARTFVETVRWFASDDARDPLGFLGICRALRLDPAPLREGLKSIRARARSERRGLVLH